MARREAQALCVEGDVFVQQEKWDEAIKAFRAAAEKDPKMSKAWLMIGLVENRKNGGHCEAAWNECAICFEDFDAGTIRCVLIPCGHLGFCLACGSRQTSCPICRVPVAHAQPTYQA